MEAYSEANVGLSARCMQVGAMSVEGLGLSGGVGDLGMGLEDALQAWAVMQVGPWVQDVALYIHSR
jgi:hypothetical protein